MGQANSRHSQPYRPITLRIISKIHFKWDDQNRLYFELPFQKRQFENEQLSRRFRITTALAALCSVWKRGKRRLSSSVLQPVCQNVFQFDNPYIFLFYIHVQPMNLVSSPPFAVFVSNESLMEEIISMSLMASWRS